MHNFSFKKGLKKMIYKLNSKPSSPAKSIKINPAKPIKFIKLKSIRIKDKRIKSIFCFQNAGNNFFFTLHVARIKVFFSVIYAHGFGFWKSKCSRCGGKGCA